MDDMDDMAWDFIKLTLIIMVMFMFLSSVTYYEDSKLLERCKRYLSDNGYSFVSYHHSTSGSPEECWGQKNGNNIRVY